MAAILLPTTDAGALVQFGVVIVGGSVLFGVAIRRRARNAAWLAAGVTMALLGFFALRTVH